jgi:hypothetical protein
MEQAIALIMALGASWTDQIAAKFAPMLVVLFGNRECRAATAGDK